MQKTRVAIIGTTGLPARYGGFETLAHHLVAQLGGTLDITVYCSSKYFAKSGTRLTTFMGARLHYLPFNANGYQSIPYDVFSLLHAIRRNDVILLLGTSGALILPLLKLFTRKPILVNIDGQEWKRPKWNWFVQKLLHLSEKFAVRFADKVIADNKVIQHYVESNYKRLDSCLIEYGGDHVSALPFTAELLQQYPFLQSPYAFNVSRIEPENNIHMILDAFSRAPEHRLVIVGLWNHSAYGSELRKRYGRYENIFLLDPIYHQHTLNMIRANARLYVHGHSAGGTNPGLVEAMCLGLPVLSYGISYNRETTNHRARYFNTSEELLEQLPRLTDTVCKTMGQDLKRYGMARYNWERIAGLYNALIRGENLTIARLKLELSGRAEANIQMIMPVNKKVA